MTSLLKKAVPGKIAVYMQKKVILAMTAILSMSKFFVCTSMTTSYYFFLIYLPEGVIQILLCLFQHRELHNNYMGTLSWHASLGYLCLLQISTCGSTSSFFYFYNLFYFYKRKKKQCKKM